MSASAKPDYLVEVESVAGILKSEHKILRAESSPLAIARAGEDQQPQMFSWPSTLLEVGQTENFR